MRCFIVRIIAVLSADLTMLEALVNVSRLIIITLRERFAVYFATTAIEH
jgi:hypothetical protein